MHELLSKQNIDYLERAREVAEKYVRPQAAELDRTGEYGWEILEALKSYELTGIWVPKEYGGQDAGVLDLCLVVEQLSRACGGIGVAYSVNALGSFPIILHGTEEQKKKYLPSIATGESLIAFGLSEKASGSDAGSLRTTALKDGDDFVINGHKKWNTNGAVASTFTIYALTDPDRGMRGISAFIIEKDTPGFTVGKREDTMGIRTVPVNELDFVDCRVPASQLLGGREGGGWTNVRLDLQLTAGSMYQDPYGSNREPNPLLYTYFPDLEYDTYAAGPGGYPSMMSFVESSIDNDTFAASWFDMTDSGSGVFRLAQITLSDDAAGSITGTVYDVLTAGVGVDFTLGILGGLIS